MFASGSHRWRPGGAADTGVDVHGLRISAVSEREVWKRAQAERCAVACDSYMLGDVSFHAGWTLHRTPANATGIPRAVHTIQYAAEDARWSAEARAGAATALGGEQRAGELLRSNGVPMVWHEGTADARL